jgi:hypothetical protein
MLVVPLKGDKIETKDGVTFTVLSFTNYRDKGPAVYVEHTPGVPSDAVYFFDITKINGKAVEFVPGAKVFKSIGEVRRRYQLPQVNDIITIRSPDGARDVAVTGLKLHKKGDLAKGLLVIGVEKDTDDKVQARLNQITDIRRDIGDSDYSRDRFLSYYDDYRGSR